MWIDTRGDKRTFGLTGNEQIELKEVFTKIRLVTSYSKIYGKYFDSSTTPTLHLQMCDRELLAVLIDTTPICLKHPRHVILALDREGIDVKIGIGALAFLNRHTNIFKRLKYHNCI